MTTEQATTFIGKTLAVSLAFKIGFVIGGPIGGFLAAAITGVALNGGINLHHFHNCPMM